MVGQEGGVTATATRGQQKVLQKKVLMHQQGMQAPTILNKAIFGHSPLGSSQKVGVQVPDMW